MVDDTPLTRRQFVGHISGFDVKISDDQEIIPGRSLSYPKVINGLINALRLTDATQVNNVLTALDEHLTDTGNPHNIFPEDVGTSLSDHLFPGTIPKTEPAYVFDSSLLEEFFDGTYAHAGLAWVTNRYGYLVQPDVNTPLIDHTVDSSGLAVFPTWSNRFTRSHTPTALAYLTDDGTARLLASGTSVIADNVGLERSPKGNTDDFVNVTSGDITSEQGFLIRSPDHQTTKSTISVFLKPGTRYIDLVLKDRFNGDPTGYTATVDLDNDATLDFGEFKDIIVNTYTNGWKRLFVMHDVNPSPTLDLQGICYDDIETKYPTSDVGSVICSLFGIQSSDGYIPAPYLETSGSVETHSALSLVTPSTINGPALTIVLQGKATYYNTPSIIDIGGVNLITQNNSTFTIADLVHVGPIATENYQDLALIASFDGSLVKGRLNERIAVSVAAAGPNVPIDTYLTLKNLNGYIESFLVYSEVDDADMASFFIGTEEV